MLLGHSVATADGVIMMMDEAVCDMLQRSSKDIVGRSYRHFTHPDDLKGNVAQVAALRLKGGRMRLRKRYMRAHGSPIWTHVEASRLAAGRDAGRLVGSIYLAPPTEVAATPEALRNAALQMDLLTRLRQQEFGAELVTDHGWAILLHIYLAEAEGRILGKTCIGDRTGMCEATNARWINLLEVKGLIERPARGANAIQLTGAGLAKVERLLAASL